MKDNSNRNWNEVASTSQNIQYVSTNPAAYITIKGAVGEPKPVTQSSYSNGRIGVNKDYLISIVSFIRILLIIDLFGAWIAAAASQKNANFMSLVGDYKATRIAYIVFSVVACFFSIVIFVFHLLNLPNVKPFDRFNFFFVVLLLDGLFLFPMIALGITCAVRESDYNKRNFVPQAVNKGAFAAMAFFALFAVVLYGATIAIGVIQTLKSRNSQRVTQNAGNSPNTGTR